MKSLLASLALVAAALPGAAFAAEGEAMKCCCCEKMKQEGQGCCAKDGAKEEGDHSGHGEPRVDVPAE